MAGSFWIIHEKFPKEVVRVEIRDNEKKIDSLMLVIGEKSSVIDSLKKQKERVIERVVVKVKKLKTLPPDSTIQIFHEDLQAYGEVESECPTLKEDSSVVCSLDNLRGANIIAAKYEGKVEEAEILKGIITINSGIIANKDSIIRENSVIISKMAENYTLSLEELNSQIKKEITKKEIATYGGTFLLGVIGSLLLFGK